MLLIINLSMELGISYKEKNVFFLNKMSLFMVHALMKSTVMKRR